MYEIIKYIFSKLKYYNFRLIHASQMLSCEKQAYIEGPFRIDGAEHIKLGERSVIQGRSWLYCKSIDASHAQLTIGARCVLGYNNHITAVKEVVVEDDVLTANNVYISDNLHSYKDWQTPIIHQPIEFKRSVRIGRGSWIGENACIIGANVGRNSVIGANSIVTHDIPDYSVAVGVPAIIIRQYNKDIGSWVDL